MSLDWYIKVLKVLASVVVLLTLTTVFLVWLAHRPPGQEAAGQELTVQEVTAPTDSLPLTVEVPELTQEVTSEPIPEGIPGLSVMEVIGNLEHFHAEGGFVCEGPDPTEGSGSKWVCSAPGGELPGTYELSVIGDGPLSVQWVVATTRGVSEERAAEYFTYIAGLCLQDTNEPLNPEAWVKQNVTSGGHVSTGGVELAIYGTEEERTLQVVAMGFATD